MHFIKRYYLLFTLMALCAGCAVEVPPSGGPGDTTAPAVVYNYPENLTKNFHDDKIVLEFSKYMSKAAVNENMSISPNVPMKFDWSGKELEISFAKPLDSSTTYALNLGTEYKDIYGFKPAESYGLVFSTGSVIDTGMIPGRVVAKSPSGNYVFVYRLDDINPDTLNPGHTQPDYKVQLGTTGNFSIVALKDGKYRLFSIRDELKNNLYDPADAYSSANRDFEVRGGKSDSVFILQGPAIDKSGPSVMDAEGINARTVALNFSESLDTFALKPTYFAISDSSGNTKFPVAGVYLGSKSMDKIYIVADKGLPLNTKLKVSVEHSGDESIRDSSGNLFTDSMNYAYFFAFEEPDTAQPKFITSPVRDSSTSIEVKRRMIFGFTNALDAEGFRKAFSFVRLKDSSSVDYNINFLTGNLIMIGIRNKLEDDTWYRMKVDGKYVKSVSGIKAKDTIYKFDFKTEDTRGRSDISGKIVRNGFCDGPLILDMISTKEDRIYTVSIDSTNSWSIEGAMPGEYYFRVFCDTNRNGIYDYGSPYPYSYAEKFMVLSNRINVRAKWNIDDVRLILPEAHE